MASSGTSAFTITGGNMVKSALRKLRVLIDGTSPTPQMITDGVEDLNIMLKSWWARPGGGLKVWCYQQIIVPMVTAQAAYTIGPVGANVTAVRPLRLFEYGNFIRETVSGFTHDTPLRLISRQEYQQFGAKQAPGVPNSIYYNGGIDIAGGLTSPGTGYGTVFVYCVPSDATRSLYLNAQRPLYDMSELIEFDVPSEWFHAIRLNLMASLCDDYEVPEDRLRRVKSEARDALEMVAETSIEEASTSFAPDFAGMR